MSAFRTTIARIAMQSAHSAVIPATSAAAIRIPMMMLLN